MSGVPKRYQPDEMEREVLARWQRDDVFGQQLAQGRAAYEEDPNNRFIFLEGPPTANGLPHPGHVLTRTLKDSVNRYHAMHGKWVPRKAGWDCHGLPVEIEVQKELGIEHVDEIEKYGVEPFLAKCKESVFRYKQVWEEMTARVGMWVDFDNAYVTMDDGYIDTVWWSLKRLHDQGLLVKSYKVVPYCPLTGTTYSSHEVAQGYKDVVDSSVFAKFHLKNDPDNARILSWTTTPWTLPGNVALAVGPDIDYVKVRVTETSDNAFAKEGEVLIVAKSLIKKALRNHHEIIAELKGSELIGLAYEPLFPGAIDIAADNAAPWDVKADKTWTILPADWVTTEDGTGVVHTAVMYGEDDFNLGRDLGLPAQHTVGLDGNFTSQVPGLAGKYVKDDETEQAIFAWLEKNDTVYRTESYEHTYPHCWRTGAPLLYYAMESWYIRMSTLRDRLLANNDNINWVPETIREGRMGDWLRNVKDWAFSRSRFWGTPLPVWVCQDEACGKQTCMGGKADLATHGVDVPELHRPHVDVPIKCPDCGGEAIREPYVIDVWYDSGAAQFAQFHDRDNMNLEDQWPIDFIAEGLDQTRGWFYSLLAIATALGSDEDMQKAKQFQGPPYKNVVVNGLILAEDGQKMSKSKKNYVSPDKVFATHGADATRWYLLSATAPWQDKRFYDDAVRDTYGKFFSTLWNTFLFWKQYADLDGWKPSLKTLDELSDITANSQLDQWLISRLEATIATANEEADKFHLHKATRAIEDFVVGDLSNWWVRRSRDRFWAEDATEDKNSAHATLWWALHSVSRLVAPWAPFMVEHIWEHVQLPEDQSSVHLARYPVPGVRHEELETAMAAVRSLAESGRSLRSKVGIPTRHPLGRALVVGANLGELAALLQDELNVKDIELPASLIEAQSYVAQPNRAALGPAFKQLAPKIAEAIMALNGDDAHAALAAGKTVGVNVEGEEHPLTGDHILFEQTDREGWATVEVGDAILALYTVRDDALLNEAFAREVVRRVQELRKELDLEVDATMALTLSMDAEARTKLVDFETIIAEDVRADSVLFAEIETPLKVWDIDGVSVSCTVDAEGLVHSEVEAA